MINPGTILGFYDKILEKNSNSVIINAAFS